MTASTERNNEVAELRREVGMLRELIDDLKSGRPVHLHLCPQDGHQWRCHSPYCTKLPAKCPEHGGTEPTDM